MAFRRLHHLPRNQSEPAPSTFLQASDQVAWTSVRSVRALPNLIILYKGKSSLLQPLVSGIWDSWRQDLPVKMEVKKKRKSIDHMVFSISFVTTSSAPFSGGPTFFLVFLLLMKYLQQPFLVVLHVPVRFNSRWGLSFLIPSVCNWVVPVTMLPAVLTLLSHPAKCQFSTSTLNA